MASTSRLLDVLPALAGDPRVEVWFTADDGSAFHAGVADRLTAVGARLVDWTEAIATPFDLALSASDNGELRRLAAPLVLMPHGAGYHRFSAQPGEEGTISGLARSALLDGDRVIPSAVVVAHPDQVDRLAEVSPRLAARALVAGDPCLDRIVAGRRREREYRTAFGADHRDLVLLSSTWGPNSLLGRQPDLPARLVGALPADEYRVAAVLHPNVWVRHGPWQVRSWLARAIDAGLVPVPPEEGWRAALTAARLVVSDHGSISCYAVASGAPVLLAEDGGTEVVPGSPMDALRRALPRLVPGVPLRDQVERTVAGHDPNRADALAATMFARRGESLEVLRDALYRLLNLDRPPWPVIARAVPVPVLNRAEPTSFAVRTRVEAGTVTVERFPAGVAPEDEDRPPGAWHLAVLHTEPDDRLWENAAVLASRRAAPTAAEAAGRAERDLARWPGARVAAVPTAAGAVLLAMRGGAVRTATPVEPRTRADPGLCGSAAYALELAGPLPDRITVHTGRSVRTVTLTA